MMKQTETFIVIHWKHQTLEALHQMNVTQQRLVCNTPVCLCPAKIFTHLNTAVYELDLS